MSDAFEQTVTIKNDLGLHARAATKLVQLATKYPCDVTVAKDGLEVNGKSILNLFTLVASKGSIVTIRARGTGASECVAAIAKLIDEKFGEG